MQGSGLAKSDVSLQVGRSAKSLTLRARKEERCRIRSGKILTFLEDRKDGNMQGDKPGAKNVEDPCRG